MRKRFAFALLLIILVATVGIGEKKPNIYSRSMPIMKILTHPLGFKVYYLKDNMQLGSFYVPKEWFMQAGGKASIIWGKDAEYPFCSIFWVDAAFHHVKLYLREDLLHRSWGSLEVGEPGIQEKFKVDTIELEF